MSCTHDKAIACFTCRPDLWTHSDDELLRINCQILQAVVSNLLLWKRAYYQPNHPEVHKNDAVPDSRYDGYESSLKAQFPDHPILAMVDYNESQHQACLNYFTELFGYG